MLLLETNKVLIEHSGRNTYVVGTFLVGDQINKNGRLYPTRILEHAVNEIRADIKDGKFLGELGHPTNATGDISRVSHVIKSLERKGNVWVGKAQLVSEGAGKVAKAMIDAGAKLGISSRGVGTYKEQNGAKVINEDYKLLSFDLVNDPSTPGAYLDAITEACKHLQLNKASRSLTRMCRRALPFGHTAEFAYRSGS